MRAIIAVVMLVLIRYKLGRSFRFKQSHLKWKSSSYIPTGRFTPQESLLSTLTIVIIFSIIAIFFK